MRSVFVLAALFIYGLSYGQGSGFSFSYTGPTQIIVGPDCIEPLNWGHPNTPTATSNLPGGMIVSFNIYSISGGYQIGDNVGGGTVVTVFYQAIDNFGNSALFGFSIAFVDLIPPVFDPLSLPANLTVNCIGNFPVANVEVSDNCEDQDIVLTVTFTETNNAVMCTGGLITRTWVADDDLGNTAIFVQTITVLADVTPPVIANNLVNGSAQCVNAMAQYSTWLTAQRNAFNATDSGCGVMTLSDNAPSPAMITSFCGEIVVTFTAKDNCNNISTVQRTFTVVNNVPPVITTPASGASGNCDQPGINQTFVNWIATHGGAAATDDCSSVVWTTSPASPSLSDTCNAAINVMFIAGDGCNNFDTTSASFFVTDNTPPTFTVDPGTMVLSCSATTIDSLLMNWLVTSGNSQANDFCTHASQLTRGYRLGGIEHTLAQVLSAWQDSLAAGCNDNVIIGGVGINNVMAYLAVQFTYDDACDNEAGKTGFFGITDNGRPQFVTQPSDASFMCSESGNWQSVFNQWYDSAGGATYMDACSSVDIQASITADSAIQYLTAALDTACMQGAAVTIQFTLIDDCGNQSMTMPSATFNLQDTIAPELTTPATDFVASCSLDGQTQLNNWLDTLAGAQATDGCGTVNWIFTWTDTSGQANNGVPGNGPYPEISSLNCTSGFEIIFTATDICQNSVSDTAVFSLIDTLAPVITIIDDSIHLACNDTIPVDTPQVVDGCNGEILLVYQDDESAEACAGSPEMVTRIWTATDECGNSSTAQVFYFRIDSIAPTFELPSDTVAFCSVDTLELINLQDNCDPAPVSSSEDVITGMPCQQILIRTWTVSDACGNSATAVQSFDLSDFTPLVIQYSPGHVVYTCSEGNVQDSYEQWLDSVVVADGCSDVDYFIAIPGSYVLEDTATWPGTPLPDSIFLSCSEEVMILGDLVAFDVCGNVIIEQISFSVNDTTAPVIHCAAVIVVEPDTSTCTGLVHLEAPPVEEICYPEDVKLVLVINNGDTITLDSSGVLDTIMEVGVHMAQWIASDCKGNTATCNTIIEIIDENAISLSCPSDTVLYTTEVSCIDSLWIYPPFTTIGKCGKGAIELRFEIQGNAAPDSVVFESAMDSVLVTFGAGFHNVLLIARDSTGDIDTCKYFIELRDTITPVIICQIDTAYLHPSGAVEFDVSMSDLVMSASDNCAVQAFVYDPAILNCESAGQNVEVTIILFDENGNSDSCTSELFVATQPLIPEWFQGLCDDTLRLFANIPPGPVVSYTFVWSGPNGFISNEEDPLLPGADSTFSGTYFLSVQSENGCIASGSVEVVIESLASPQIMISTDTICAGEQVEITSQAYSGNVSYQWYQVLPDGDTVISITNTPAFIFSPDTTGNYLFFAIVVQDTCASNPSETIALVVLNLPEASIADQGVPLCFNDSLFLAPSNVNDSLSYLWTGPGGFISNEIFPQGIPASEIDSPAIFYLVTSNGNCSSIADSIEILIQPAVMEPSITGDAQACEGGAFTLNATAGAEQYLWIDPSLGTTVTSNNTLTIISAEIIHSGEWHVIAIQNGCRSDTSGVFVVQIDTATIVEITTPSDACEGDLIELTSAPIINGSYLWSGPGGFTSDLVSPTIVAAEGTYTLFIQTATGCEAADSLMLNLDLLPAILPIETNAGLCATGVDNVILWALTNPPSDGSYEFFWSGPMGFISQDSSPVIQNFNSSLNGVYQLYITNGACTTDTVSLTIDVTDSPSAPMISGQTDYCFGDSITLNIISPVAGGIYTWTAADTTYVVTAPGTLIVADASQDMGGIYSVVVSLDGCVSAFSTINVQVRPSLPAPVITSAPSVCEGDSLILSLGAPPGANIQWFGPNSFSSNEIQPVIFPAMQIHAGEYFALYEWNGCLSDTSASFSINVQSSLNSPFISASETSVCINAEEIVTLCIDQNSVIPGAMYTWMLNGSSVIAGPTPDVCIDVASNLLQNGTNSISAFTSLQACISEISDAVIIIGDQFPAIDADAGLDMQYCPDEIIMLDASDPFPATGEWSAVSSLVTFANVSDPNTTIDGLPSGDYTLNWTLSYLSCVDFVSDDVLISIIPPPLVFRDSVNVLFGQTAEFSVTANDSLHGQPFTLHVVTAPSRGNAVHAGNGIFRYTPHVGFVGTDMMIYRICSTDCPEECAEAIVIIKVGDEDDCFTPTLFTPNDDGVNDLLILPCLQTTLFPDNKIIVFNEWGDAVFTASPYQNNWDGRANGTPLPVGTYFYIMDFGDGKEPKRTFLILER